MTRTEIPWLLLIASLPTASGTPRMRLWRAVNTLGCMSLGDGAYLLPDFADHAIMLASLAEKTNLDGGKSWVVSLITRSSHDQIAFQNLFDRSTEYAAIVDAMKSARKDFTSQSQSDLAKQIKRLGKEFNAIERIDFFPNRASSTARAAWADFQESANAIFSPNEPHSVQRQIPLLNARDYQGRIWATRHHLWVDRVASAWLILRFIDRRATFIWLDAPADCPSDALGFDFDGAAFTHVGDKVTFEVLMTSFDLVGDAGLVKIASLVHCLDVGGPTSPEAAGFEAILAGAKARLSDDDALLDNIGAVLDSLYSHFRTGSSP